ncbi:MAG: YhbY family RNA-binding protein [Clostridiales bacterium]|nr:YhbY family RNA-binding protein [Clostridiales bacterium]
MNSKQRAALRAAASTEPPLFQCGKEGVTPSFCEAVDKALTARELIKISVLRSSPEAVREAATNTASKVGAELVACIGNRFVLYRFSPDCDTHVLAK